MMVPLNLFFNRVSEIAAETLNMLCKELRITDEVAEIIWGIIRIILGQESQMLVGRHLDQLILCGIYGVCKVHSNCIKQPAG